jgi:hypothetical protein
MNHLEMLGEPGPCGPEPPNLRLILQLPVLTFEVIAKFMETTNLRQAGRFRPKGRFTQQIGIMLEMLGEPGPCGPEPPNLRLILQLPHSPNLA